MVMCTLLETKVSFVMSVDKMPDILSWSCVWNCHVHLCQQLLLKPQGQLYETFRLEHGHAC